MISKKALRNLDEALATTVDTDLLRAGCIQYFEFSFELAWKSIKMFSGELGLEGWNSPRASLKLAFSQGWIDNEVVWLDMLSARNRMAHVYNSSDALGVYSSLKDFLPELWKLLSSIRSEREKIS